MEGDLEKTGKKEEVAIAEVWIVLETQNGKFSNEECLTPEVCGALIKVCGQHLMPFAS